MRKKQYIEHLKRIIGHLEKSEDKDIDEEEYFPNILFHHYADLQEHMHAMMHRMESKLEEINNCCKSGSDQINKFIVKKGGFEEGGRFLKEWIFDADELIICDPYYFQWTKTKVFETESQYSDELLKILPHKVKSLTVYHLPGPNKRIYSKIQTSCQSIGRRLKIYATNEIHDRVWIKNNSVGISVGTSFNGLGNKAAFILPLPEQDLEQFKKNLFEIRNI